MIYRHPEPESLFSKIVKRGLRITRRREKLVDSFKTLKFKQKPASIPRSLKKLCTISETSLKNHTIWTLTPRKSKSKKVIFYLHGGGHVNNIITLQWLMLKRIISLTGATIIVPDYPLLPETNHRGLYEWLENSFQQLFADVDMSSENLIIMGDSAGGAVTLGLAQLLRNNNFTLQPSRIILISPELDFSKLHEDTYDYAPYDAILSPEIFDLLVPMYAAGSPRDHYLVSPGLGDLRKLGKISIFIGTHDILYPYSLELKQRLIEENIDFNFYEYPAMAHVWMAIPFMKESNIAIRQIADLILGKDTV